MRIEAADVADLPAIQALLRKCRLPVDGLDAHLESALVARDGTGVVASAVLEIYGRHALLRSVAVDEPRRGTGLGQQVVSAALDLAKARRLRGVFLLTETAARFFPKFGFTPIERSAVPDEVKQSVEFNGALCASAQAMRLDLA